MSRFPDASVPVQAVEQDISNLSAIHAGGFEFIPFYLYGLATSDTPPTDWNEYGYGTSAYKEAFSTVLSLAKSLDLLVDFAVGANQGQGSPAEQATQGLAVQLVSCEETDLG